MGGGAVAHLAPPLATPLDETILKQNLQQRRLIIN